MPERIEILLAVNEEGDGWVMGWDGDRTEPGELSLSAHDAFGEDVSCCGRGAGELGICGHPKEPGVHRFRGTISWKPNYDETVFQLSGCWESLWVATAALSASQLSSDES
jgi:hypothetical protein